MVVPQRILVRRLLAQFSRPMRATGDMPFVPLCCGDETSQALVVCGWELCSRLGHNPVA